MGADLSHRIRRLLEHARRTTPHYAALLPPPADPLPADLEALFLAIPTLRRQDLRRASVRLQSKEADPAACRIVRTTGTTGEPVAVVLDEGARRADADALAAYLDRSLGDTGWRGGDLFHVALHAGASSRAMAAPWDPGRRVVKWNLLHARQAPEARFLESLAHVTGHVVTALPSVAELLARRVLQAGAGGRVRPSILVLSGEVVTPEVRSLATQAFGCATSAMYTLAEVGIVGVACETGGNYHVEERNALVEILDEEGRPLPPGRDGEVVVTALENLAMPLLRCRSGDRGHWLEDRCYCGLTSRRLALTTARTPAWLRTASGAVVNIVRFAKVLARLDVDRYSFDQSPDGAVRLLYTAERPLDSAAHAVLQSAVHSAAGPVEVSVRRVPRVEAVEAAPPASVEPSLAEPAGPALEEVASWLTRALQGEAGIDAAVLTGSALEPASLTRFSDIDLLILAQRDEEDERWLALARRLRGGIPRLLVHVDRLDGLAERAPLLSCRILREQVIVAGRLDEERLHWPPLERIWASGRYWAQQAVAMLWERWLTLDPGADPLREAAFASKVAIDALRYRELARGGRETRALALLHRARTDPELAQPWLMDLVEAFEVARELRPPPITGPQAAERGLAAALRCVRGVAAELAARPAPPAARS